MFGIFKKKQPPELPPALPPSPPPPLPGSEPFWNEMGMCRLVPAYIQLHLALRSPQHGLSRRQDGSIETDDVPPLIQDDPQVQADITRLMTQQLPNDPSFLSSLSPEQIVSRLGDIYTKVTGKDMYAVVCKKWCEARKLL